MSRVWFAAANMAMLYAGRTSSVIVAFLFLPLFNRVLGPEQFGIVAVILSFQALLVMMDLGMSVLIGREISVSTTSSTAGELIKLLRTAEMSLTGFYGVLLVLALLAKALGLITSLSWVALGGTVLLFWVQVLQNLSYSALIARRDYAAGSILQIIGVLVRAAATLMVLKFYASTLEAFVFTQLLFGAGHLWVTRHFGLRRMASGEQMSPVEWPTLNDALSLTKAGGALVLFSAAGAAVLQLDKPIISMFASAASVTPYYLASLLCMTPISLLAGPVSQYFQPAFLKEVTSGTLAGARATLRRFVLSIFLVTCIPTILLWSFRTQIIEIWLGQSSDITAISRYVEILLPGVALGALGFVPYSLLIKAKDYRFQAVLSASMTITTLLLTVLAAAAKNVEAICIVYSAYHAISTLASWLRATTRPEVKAYARYSGALALLLIAGLVLALSVTKFTF